MAVRYCAKDIKSKIKKVIAFYQYGSVDYVGTFGKFDWLSTDDQKEIINYAHTRNVRLLVSIGGAVGTSSLRNIDAATMGNEIDQLVKRMGLDGIDIDVEDPALFPLITELTNHLGEKWAGEDLLITHAPQSANFQDNKGQPSDYFTVYQKCGVHIDYLLIQFYNQGCTHDTYEKIFVPYQYDCWNLAWISTGKNPKADLGSVIPLKKLIIGKPIEIGIYGANNGFVQADDLGQMFQKAKSIPWNSGMMIWEYVPDSDKAGRYLKDVLRRDNS